MVDGRVVRAPGLELVFDEAHPPRLVDGWVAPEYGVKHRAPAVWRGTQATPAPRS